ncbi:hypothetical protein CPB86DRAFT_878581 [Serendipita vermifera]|nr:hypothetical protein CPB86DRAFT_878581 [Serendipita vermifera]
MDYDLPPPPYSLRISKAVVLDQDDSLIKGIDEMSSSIREITTKLDATMVEMARVQALTGNLGAMKECKQLWRRHNSNVFDATLDLKVRLLDQFGIVANQTDQMSLEELKEILNYIDSQTFVEVNGNEIDELIAKLDLTIASLQPNRLSNSHPDSALVKREERNTHVVKSVILPAKLLLPPVYLLVVWRYYAHFLDKMNLDKMSSRLPWRWSPEHIRTHILLCTMAPAIGLYAMGMVQFWSVYKRKSDRSTKHRAVADKVDQSDDPNKDTKMRICGALEEVKLRVKASLQTLDIIRRIHDTVKEDVNDHLEVVKRSDFEDAKKRTEIVDSLKLSDDLYSQISLAIFRLTSPRA